MRQRSIFDFCQRQQRPQPSTAQHGRGTAVEGSTDVERSSLSDAWQSLSAVDPTSSTCIASQIQDTASQTLPDSPYSIASSRTAPHDSNVGRQLCTISCPIAASLWSTMEAPDRKALQAVNYFIKAICAGISRTCQPSTHLKAQQRSRKANTSQTTRLPLPTVRPMQCTGHCLALPGSFEARHPPVLHVAGCTVSMSGAVFSSSAAIKARLPLFWSCYIHWPRRGSHSSASHCPHLSSSAEGLCIV